MYRIGTSRLVWFVATASVAGVVAGCLPHRVGLTSTGMPQYADCNIRYRIASPLRTIVAHRGPSDASILPASHSEMADAPERDWTAATLTVSYPHPDGIPDMARVELQLLRLVPREFAPPPSFTERMKRTLKASPFGQSSMVPAERAGVAVSAREIRVLDLPQYEIDLLILELARSGFFDAQHRPTGKAAINVRIDRGQTAKRWTAEPRLDELVARVYCDGQLVEGEELRRASQFAGSTGSRPAAPE